MKGELSFVEFVASLGVFISFVAYIFFLLLRYYPIYVQEVESERKRLEAYQISELLINDPGEPINWENPAISLDSIKRLGLSDSSRNKTNLISSSKVNRFNDICNQNYEEVKKRVDSEFDFSLILLDLTHNNLLINCLPYKVVVTPSNITVRRITAFDTGGYGELIVQVW